MNDKILQVLVRLCSHAAPAEELARKDDLTLLFSAITSWCPAYNVMWRKSAAEVLMTLSRHGLTQPVVSYIHSKYPYRALQKCLAVEICKTHTFFFDILLISILQ